ncbi:hypothetical protein ACYULU_08985 [Breznakiellaceae bacterium SP9]
MKKFFIILVILLLIGGGGFFYGWLQFFVPPGSYGVLRSKSHGVSQNLIRSGDFTWEWKRLIPSNTEILVFTPRILSHTFSDEGVLPAGESYAALAGVTADFSYKAQGRLAFSIKPDSLIGLVEAQNIAGQEQLAEYEEILAGEIRGKLLEQIKAVKSATLEEFILKDNTTALLAAINTAFPTIENLSITVTNNKVPDFELYYSLKALYTAYLEKQKEYLQVTLLKNAQERLSTQFSLEELAQYGEVLTKYPILVQLIPADKPFSIKVPFSAPDTSD